MACRLGDDVYEWRVEQLGEWLRNEGMDDCVDRFAMKNIDGCGLLNLSEHDIKILNISHESKKKLSKAIEKFKKRKRGKFDRMFGDNQETHKLATKRPSSLSRDDGVMSDDDGWGTDEWDSDSGEGGDESSDDGGEYLEPEDDFSKPTECRPEKTRVTGSYHRESPAMVQKGLVAQLREGIAQSLHRNTAPSHYDETSYADEDIYDLPPDDEDLYEEPSDSSGGAVVVRPPAKPPRVDDAEYLLPRGEDIVQHDTYETPLEGKDLSSSPSHQRPFIPTQIQQDNRFTQPDINANNMETYDMPEFAEEEECNYEIAEPAPTTETPPPRPPKNVGKPVSAPCPKRPPKQQPSPSNSFTSQPTAPKTVFRKPPPNNVRPSSEAPTHASRNNQPTPNSFTQRFAAPSPSQGSPVHHGGRPMPPMKQESPVNSGNFPGRPGRPGSSQGFPASPPSNSFPVPNKPTLPTKQGSPVHSQNGSLPPSPNRLPGKLLSSHGSQFQGVPMQPSQTPLPRPKPNAVPPKPSPAPGPQPTEQKGPPLAPKSRPRPMDPTKREPAPPPVNEVHRKTSGSSIGTPDSPKRSEPPRKTSGPRSPISTSSETFETSADSRRPLPVPQMDTGALSPRPTPRGVMAPHRDPMPTPGPDIPQRSPGLPLPSPTHRSVPLPATPGMERIPEALPPEPAVPPRPPKQGFSHPDPVPTPHRHRPDKTGVPLPAPPPGAVPSTPSRDQSSGSSIELSGSADEPVRPLSKRSSGSNLHRVLPPTPAPAAQSPMDVMREAPWYHGNVDRRRSEANLKATNVNGAFLIRDSTKKPNEYSLSLLHNGEIRHLQIPKKDGKYVLGASGIQKFDNVLDLVNYYRQNEVDLAKGGKTKLTAHAQNIAR